MANANMDYLFVEIKKLIQEVNLHREVINLIIFMYITQFLFLKIYLSTYLRIIACFVETKIEMERRNTR